MTRKTSVNQRQSTIFFYQVPVEWSTIKVMNPFAISILFYLIILSLLTMQSCDLVVLF